MIRFFITAHTYSKERWPKVSGYVRYGISGATGACVDFIVYIVLTRGFVYWEEHFLSANIVSFIIASLTTFIMHKYFSFEQKKGNTALQYIKFLIVSLVYLAIVQGLLYVGTAMLGLHDIFTKVIAQLIATVWNYLANRYWSFRIKHE